MQDKGIGWKYEAFRIFSKKNAPARIMSRLWEGLLSGPSILESDRTRAYSLRRNPSTGNMLCQNIYSSYFTVTLELLLLMILMMLGE